MNTKKLQHTFFASLLILSISSSLYLNFGVEDRQDPILEMTETAPVSSERLMADIDVFQKLIQKVVQQVVFL